MERTQDAASGKTFYRLTPDSLKAVNVQGDNPCVSAGAWRRQTVISDRRDRNSRNSDEPGTPRLRSRKKSKEKQEAVAEAEVSMTNSH